MSMSRVSKRIAFRNLTLGKWMFVVATRDLNSLCFTKQFCTIKSNIMCAFVEAARSATEDEVDD